MRSPIAIRSKRPNAGRKALQPGARSRRASTPSASASAAARERVVDVVEARAAPSSTRRVPSGVTSSNETLVEAVQLDLARDDVERRPRVPAGGAAVVAEVPDVGRRVVVRRPAADAPLRVGRVLELGERVARVVEPEARSLRRARARGRRPAGRRRSRRARRRAEARDARSRQRSATQLELAVAVELVAEQVPEADAPAAGAAAPPRAAPPRPPRTARARRRGAARRAEATPETRFAPERLCASRTRGAQDLARPSRRSSSCRSSPRRAPTRAEAARRGGRPPRDRASRAAFRAPSCRRRRRPAARAPAAARASRISAERGTRTAIAGGRYLVGAAYHSIEGTFAPPHPAGGCSEARGTDTFRQVFAGPAGNGRCGSTEMRPALRRGKESGRCGRTAGSEENSGRARCGARVTAAASLVRTCSGARAAAGS